jgi:hypothetical protein
VLYVQTLSLHWLWLRKVETSNNDPAHNLPALCCHRLVSTQTSSNNLCSQTQWFLSPAKLRQNNLYVWFRLAFCCVSSLTSPHKGIMLTLRAAILTCLLSKVLPAPVHAPHESTHDMTDTATTALHDNTWCSNNFCTTGQHLVFKQLLHYRTALGVQTTTALQDNTWCSNNYCTTGQHLVFKQLLHYRTTLGVQTTSALQDNTWCSKLREARQNINKWDHKILSPSREADVWVCWVQNSDWLIANFLTLRLPPRA